jgi:hypothetical protein
MHQIPIWMYRKKGAALHKPFEEGPKAEIKRLQSDVRDLASELTVIAYHMESAWFGTKPSMIAFEIDKAIDKLNKVNSGLEKIKKDLKGVKENG